MAGGAAPLTGPRDSQGSAPAPPRDRPGGGAPLAGGARLPLAVLAVGLLVVGGAAWEPLPAGVWHDDGVYAVVGKALADGEGLRYAGVPGTPPAVKYPPAYPALLALLWSAFGSLGAVTLAAQLLNLGFLAGAGVLLAHAVHRAGVMGPWGAALAAGLAFASADVWRTALVPLSEPLFILLTAAAVAAWPGATRPGGARWRGWIALLLTAAVLTRSAGMALVVGFAAALAVGGRWRAAVAAAAPAMLTAGAWGVWAGRRAGEIPMGLRDILGPYGGWLGRQILDAPAAFLGGLPLHAQAVAARTLNLLLPGVTGGWLWVAALPLAALAGVGVVVLARRLPVVAWVAGAYVAMLLVWPFVDRRLVAPLHPLLVVLVAVGARASWRAARSGVPPGRGALERGGGPRRRAGWVGAVLALAWAAAHLGVTAVRVHDGWAGAPYRLRAERLAAAVEALERTAPAGAVVGAPEFWAALHLHGGWSSAPSARFTLRDEGPDALPWGSPEEQAALWWSVGMDHLLLEQGGQIHGDALNLVEERCPGAVGILARFPPQMLVRLEWGGDCARALGLPPRPPR